MMMIKHKGLQTLLLLSLTILQLYKHFLIYWYKKLPCSRTEI